MHPHEQYTPMLAHMHAHTYTRTYAHMHTHTSIHAHIAYTQILACMHAHTCIHTFTHTFTEKSFHFKMLLTVKYFPKNSWSPSRVCSHLQLPPIPYQRCHSWLPTLMNSTGMVWLVTTSANAFKGSLTYC